MLKPAMDMFNGIISDPLGPNSTQGEGEEEFVFLLAGSTGHDIPGDKVGGKSPAFARVVIHQAQIVFPIRLR